MPVFKLKEHIIAFPPAHFADNDGLLAEGGLINADWLLEAYKNGFLLWTSPMRYPKWWTPDPRIVLFPNDLSVPNHVSEGIANANFTVTFNQDLEGVMKFIQQIENKGEMDNGWLTGKFMKAFLEIEKRGYTISVEVYQNNALVGGAFGATNGKFFFGEYINGTIEYAREAALIELTKKLQQENYAIIDLQKETTETIDIGIKEISRSEYLRILKE